MDQEQVQNLISELQNGNERQRRAAAYKLRNFKDEIVVQALIGAYTDSDSSVRQNAVDGLRLIGTEEARNFLISHGQTERLQPEDPKAQELKTKLFIWGALFLMMSMCGYIAVTVGMVPGGLGGDDVSKTLFYIPYEILLKISSFALLFFPVGAVITLIIASRMHKNDNQKNANILLYSLIVIYIISFSIIIFLLWLPR